MSYRCNHGKHSLNKLITFFFSWHWIIRQYFVINRKLVSHVGIRSDSPVVNKDEVNNINRKFLIKFRSKFTYFYTFEPIS